jgi:hypothetical protein
MSSNARSTAREALGMQIFNALGWRYAMLLPLSALVSFALILILVLRGKGSAVPAALMLLVPLPIIVGVFGVVDGLMASFQVIARSNAAPTHAMYAQGIYMSLTTFLVGLLLAVPGYLLAVAVTFVRSLLGDSRVGKLKRDLSGRSLPESG